MRRWILLPIVVVAALLGLLAFVGTVTGFEQVHRGLPEEAETTASLLNVDTPITAPLMAEGFEGIYPPPGWLLKPLTEGGSWVQVSQSTTLSIPPHAGQHAVGHAFASTEAADSWLVSPLITPTETSELVFWDYVRYIQDYRFHGVYVTRGRQDPKYGDFEDPALGHLLTEVVPTVEDTWSEIRIDLSEFAGEPVFLGFRYSGLQGDVWALDDVVVTTGLYATTDSPTALGEITTLTATVAPGRVATLTWDLGDGTPAIGSPITHTYAGPGNYTAVVTASNSSSLVVMETAVVVLAKVHLPLVMRP
jgi:hypothetical protein